MHFCCCYIEVKEEKKTPKNLLSKKILVQRILGLKYLYPKCFLVQNNFEAKKMLQKSIIEQKMIFIGILVHNFCYIRYFKNIPISIWEF